MEHVASSSLTLPKDLRVGRIEKLKKIGDFSPLYDSDFHTTMCRLATHLDAKMADTHQIAPIAVNLQNQKC